MKRKRKHLLLVLLSPLCLPIYFGLQSNGLLPGSSSSEISHAPNLISDLKQGGYVIYVRHGEAPKGSHDPSAIKDLPQKFQNCSDSDRLLTAAWNPSRGDFI
jgi:hypothetical protein